MPISFTPHFQAGLEAPVAGSTTCSPAHTAPRCAAAAGAPCSPAVSSRPRTVPQPLPYPQCTRVPKRPFVCSFFGSTPSTVPAAVTGASLEPRPRSLASTVEEIVIAAVPASPAKAPTPAEAATSPSVPVTFTIGLLSVEHMPGLPVGTR